MRGFVPGGASRESSNSKASACNAGDLGSIPDWEDPLEKDMATHASVFAWRIPWTEEPGGLSSTGSQREGLTLCSGGSGAGLPISLGCEQGLHPSSVGWESS